MDRDTRRKTIVNGIIGDQIKSLIAPTVIAAVIIFVVILVWHFSKEK